MIVHSNSPKMLRKSIDKKELGTCEGGYHVSFFPMLEIPLGRNVLVLVTFGIDSKTISMRNR
jgi:hypothetical protein